MFTRGESLIFGWLALRHLLLRQQKLGRALSAEFCSPGAATEKPVEKGNSSGLPSGKSNIWKIHPFFMGKSTLLMAIFNSYVKLPEGTLWLLNTALETPLYPGSAAGAFASETAHPKMEVPTIYKAYIRPPHKICPYMVQYLHFRILEFPLI